MVRMICALFVLGLSVSIVAAEKPAVGRAVAAPADAIKAADTKPIECEFVKFDEKANKLTVKIKGSEKTYPCSDKCKCVSEKGDMMKCTDLKAGAKLHVWIEKDTVTKVECCK